MVKEDAKNHEAIVEILSGYVYCTGNGKGRISCKITLKPETAVMIGVLVEGRCDRKVSSTITRRRQDRDAG